MIGKFLAILNLNRLFLVLDRCSTICLVQNIGMSMVLNTILPAICGWGDTCSVLVLHDIGSQYPPLIPES